MNNIKRRDGFEGEKYISVPESAWRNAIRENPLMAQLYVTYIGYFPKAAYHYRERPEGCEDNILIYCIRGKGWFKLNGQHFEVSPNEFIIAPSTKDPMSYGADEQEPWTIYWVHFSGNNMTSFNKGFNIKMEDGAREILLNEQGIKIWESMYRNLELGYSQENLSHVNLSLYHFLATFLYPEQHTNAEIQDEKNMIKDTILYLKENLDLKLTVEDMATRNSLSTSHFSSLFKKATGMSPLDYLIHLRIQHACVVLAGYDTKIKDIALEIGYDDPFHFSRLFKKNMKVSPIQYRINRRKKEENRVLAV
ncbi:AraC family transcriptional regulator [Pedobacter gandavensis]|uniref:AraC family transcriptional regulator n=1 Tax=Pedobacter gandavensis TaxID=2679963 RepID=UPI002479AC9C|nr:AraC family transcriptional regulator [Pedobacter gandavensis]WGQ10476.1 AraC family transcriptional regulator [Pedobacter gandavensis]